MKQLIIVIVCIGSHIIPTSPRENKSYTVPPPESKSFTYKC